MGRPLLQVVIGSTRPGRVGPTLAGWLAGVAEAHQAFDVEVVDLAEVALPLYDEPHHPRSGQYVHRHTQEWSGTVSRADAFVFVVPEYNYGFNAATKNALDYLHAEWQYKPVGFVSYGGLAAGTRAVQMLKQVVTALRMVTVVESVAVPAVSEHVADGRFTPPPGAEQAATAMLEELARWAEVTAPLRAEARERAA